MVKQPACGFALGRDSICFCLGFVFANGNVDCVGLGQRRTVVTNTDMWYLAFQNIASWISVKHDCLSQHHSSIKIFRASCIQSWSLRFEKVSRTLARVDLAMNPGNNEALLRGAFHLREPSLAVSQQHLGPYTNDWLPRCAL